MYEIFFFDAHGRCNAPVLLTDGRASQEILATFMKIVPHVLVTHRCL